MPANSPIASDFVSYREDLKAKVARTKIDLERMTNTHSDTLQGFHVSADAIRQKLNAKEQDFSAKHGALTGTIDKHQQRVTQLDTRIHYSQNINVSLSNATGAFVKEKDDLNSHIIRLENELLSLEEEISKLTRQCTDQDFRLQKIRSSNEEEASKIAKNMELIEKRRLLCGRLTGELLEREQMRGSKIIGGGRSRYCQSEWTRHFTSVNAAIDTNEFEAKLAAEEEALRKLNAIAARATDAAVGAATAARDAAKCAKGANSAHKSATSAAEKKEAPILDEPKEVENVEGEASKTINAGMLLGDSAPGTLKRAQSDRASGGILPSSRTKHQTVLVGRLPRPGASRPQSATMSSDRDAPSLQDRQEIYQYLKAQQEEAQRLEDIKEQERLERLKQEHQRQERAVIEKERQYLRVMSLAGSALKKRLTKVRGKYQVSDDPRVRLVPQPPGSRDRPQSSPGMRIDLDPTVGVLPAKAYALSQKDKIELITQSKIFSESLQSGRLPFEMKVDGSGAKPRPRRPSTASGTSTPRTARAASPALYRGARADQPWSSLSGASTSREHARQRSVVAVKHSTPRITLYRTAPLSSDAHKKSSTRIEGLPSPGYRKMVLPAWVKASVRSHGT